MEVEVIVQKWGGSLRIMFPNDLVRKCKLKENEKIVINVKKFEKPDEYV